MWVVIISRKNTFSVLLKHRLQYCLRLNQENLHGALCMSGKNVSIYYLTKHNTFTFMTPKMSIISNQETTRKLVRNYSEEMNSPVELMVTFRHFRNHNAAFI